MGEDELKPIIKEIITSGVNDLGSVIKEVMKKTSGKAPGKLVSDLVKEMLGA